MPRFHFDLLGYETAMDEEGGHYADTIAVLDAARRGARELMAIYILTGKSVEHFAFAVRDDAGNLILTFPFQDAVEEGALMIPPLNNGPLL